MLPGRASSKVTSTLSKFERKSANMLRLCTVFIHLSRRNVTHVGSPCQRYEALHRVHGLGDVTIKMKQVKLILTTTVMCTETEAGVFSDLGVSVAVMPRVTSFFIWAY